MNNKKGKISFKIVATLMFITFFVVSMATDLTAQAVEEWVVRYKGPAVYQNDVATDIAVDSSGNVYVFGMSMGTSFDYATVAYDSAGNQLWSARYDGPAGGHEYSVDIAVDSSGNVYVTGWSPGTTNNYPWAADYATVAYDSAGNERWVARYNGPWNMGDYPTSMALDSSGNVYVTGYSQGSNTQYDYATVAYDSNGNQLWVRRYDSPTTGSARSNGIALDSSRNVYVTGTSSYPAPEYGDITTIAYDSAGNQLWLARYNDPLYGLEEGNAIAVDSSGNIYVTGGGHTAGIIDYDYVTVAYDSGGNELWATRYNGTGNLNDIANAIAIDSSGNVCVTGNSPGSGTQIDYATVAYDSAGTELWVARYNGTLNADDEASAISTDSSGNVYVTGWSRDIGPVMSYTTMAYNSLGTELWVMKYIGPASGGDLSYDIAADSSGNVYVTGRSEGDGWGTDYTTIKYSQFPTGPVDVDIDIKPGGDPNSINLGEHGLLPVAILGSMDFDVTDVDPVTIEIGGVALASRGSAKAPKLAFSYEDVNSDGYLDIMTFFEVQTLVSEGILTESTIALTITATLYDGTSIKGTDSVNIVH